MLSNLVTNYVLNLHVFHYWLLRIFVEFRLFFSPLDLYQLTAGVSVSFAKNTCTHIIKLAMRDIQIRSIKEKLTTEYPHHPTPLTPPPPSSPIIKHVRLKILQKLKIIQREPNHKTSYFKCISKYCNIQHIRFTLQIGKSLTVRDQQSSVPFTYILVSLSNVWVPPVVLKKWASFFEAKTADILVKQFQFQKCCNHNNQRK